MRISFWPDASQDWADIVSMCKHVELRGWDGVWLADHFMPEEGDMSEPCHEVFTCLSGLAAHVPRVRIGSMVASNTYRHPAVLANMAASLDHVSEGRLVLGLGAGWQENEHRAYGLEFYTVNERLRRMEEGCQIIKALFSNERTNFDGRFYRLVDAPLEPKPLQTRLPLMIGGGGEKVTLAIVARQADEWNVWATLETFKHKCAVLARHCEKAARDPAEIERSVAVCICHGMDDAEILELEEAANGYATLSGTTAQLVDTLGAYQEAGLAELLVPDFNLAPGTEKLDRIDRFYEEVASQFQG